MSTTPLTVRPRDFFVMKSQHEIERVYSDVEWAASVARQWRADMATRVARTRSSWFAWLIYKALDPHTARTISRRFL